MVSGKKIVFVGSLSGFGGAQKSLIMIANGLAGLGLDITIVSFNSDRIVYDIFDSIKVIPIADNEKLKIGRIITRFWNLKKKLKKIKPDLVISFWVQPAIFIAVLSKFIRFKTIYSERGDPSDKEYNGLLGFLRNIFFMFIDGFVFQTKGAKKYFSNSIQNRSVVINNSVPLKYNDFPIPAERKKIIVNVGRLHEQKNQELLINSFAEISEKFPEYKLEIYGEGELKNRLDGYIKNLNLEKKVYLKGATKNLFDEIVGSSLFVLSSDYEGMPNALMEAMALGIPCISTDCSPGGAKELITTGENGIITPRNSVAELAEAMKYMLENKNESERMGRNSKKICNTHSEDVILNYWKEYVIEVLINRNK